VLESKKGHPRIGEAGVKRLICAIFGHRFVLVRELTPHSRRIACTRCKQHFGMNDDARAVIPWDIELENMYRVIGVDTKGTP
jgi:hypothetical protein